MPFTEPGSGHSAGSPPAEWFSAVYVTDAAGVITAWSPGAARVTGYTAAEVVGHHLSILETPEQRQLGHPHDDLARAARHGRSAEERWILRKGGRSVWAETVVTSLRDGHGMVFGFTCHLRERRMEQGAEDDRHARTQQRSASAVRDDVAEFGLELGALLPRIARRARELTTADAAIIELREGIGDRARAYDGPPGFDVELGAVLAPHGNATDGAAPRCVRYGEFHESPEIIGDVCDRLGIGALLAVPIAHDGVAIGWLAVAARSPRAFDQQHAATLELVSSMLGAPIAQAQASELRRSLLAERARAQLAQRESEARFHAAMDASLDALFILDAVRDGAGTIIDFILLDANRRGEELCDFSHAEFTGGRLSALPECARLLAPIATLALVVESSAPVEQERESRDDTDAVRWIQEQIVPLGDGVTVTVRDVTARVMADAEVRRAQAAAVAANRAKTDFVARMSHELRTPLNSVIGFSNILLRNRDGALGDTDIAYLGRINMAGTHLLALINDVLDIAKVEAGRMTLEMAPVNVVAIANVVLSQLDAAAQAAAIDLTLEAPHDGLVVVADGGKLRQILLNVVGNAIKFTPSGSVTVRVVPDGAPGDGIPRPRIEVADTGIGVPADRIAAIFEAFEQAESSTTRRYGGTGLGLSISRALCEAMGFRLEVDSELGRGTTFRIELSA
jgi:PAS domain S-box-containing protein